VVLKGLFGLIKGPTRGVGSWGGTGKNTYEKSPEAVLYHASGAFPADLPLYQYALGFI